nr:insulin receptor-related protein-like [Procambarus clarkii]
MKEDVVEATSIHNFMSRFNKELEHQNSSLLTQQVQEVCGGGECVGGCQGAECVGGCVGGECCHRECVGGCTAPSNASACVACRNLAHAGVCSSACPAHTYRVGDECLEWKECKSRDLPVSEERCSKSCPVPARTSNPHCHHCTVYVDISPTGAGVSPTGAGVFTTGAGVSPTHAGVFTTGAGVSPTGAGVFTTGCGSCYTAIVNNIHEAQDLEFCSSVDALEISITGGENIEKEVGRLLRNIEVVRDYVKIFRTNITSTSILPNLRKIRGENLMYNRYSLVVVDNPNLHSLTSWTLPDHNFTVERGKVLFQSNPLLCLRQIHALAAVLGQANLTHDDESRANGQGALCEVAPLSVSVRASPAYGTLTLTVDALPYHLAFVDALYVNYRPAPTNVTLHQEPCSASDGWSVIEVQREAPKEGKLEVEVGGLAPSTRYALYVRTHAHLPAREDARSSVVYANTSAFNPSEPVGLRWASRSSSTLDLWWEPPRRPHGVVDHYLVTALALPDHHALPPHLDFCSHHDISTETEYGKSHVNDIVGDGEMQGENCNSYFLFQRENHHSLHKVSGGVFPGVVMDRPQLEPGSQDQPSAGPSYIPRPKMDIPEQGPSSQDQPSAGPHTPSSTMDILQQGPSPQDQPSTGPHTPSSTMDILQQGPSPQDQPSTGPHTPSSTMDILQQGPSPQDQPSTGSPHTPREERTTEALYTLLVAEDNANKDQLHSFRRIFQAFLTGGDGPPLVPLAQDHAHHYQYNTSRSWAAWAAMAGRYQVHRPHPFLHPPPSPFTNGTLRVVQEISRTRRLTLHHLRHSTHYLVGVVACQAPTTCTPTAPPTAHPPAEGRGVPCKLCSSVAAMTVATTAPSTTADTVPEGSLSASAHNTSVRVWWQPPQATNGALLAYHLQFTSMGSQRTRCVSVSEYEAAGGGVELEDLAPGNYTFRVRVRSRAGYGHYSAPISCLLQDRIMAREGDEKRWVSVVVVVVAMVVVVSCVVAWWWKRSYNANTIPTTLDQVDVNPFYREGFAPSEMFREEFIVWRDDLKVQVEAPLGHGYFGMVFLGELRVGGVSKRVAVKTHSDTASTEQIARFLKEAAVMQEIECHHVVRLLGVVGDYAPVYVVMELMQKGDLKTYLKKHHRRLISDQKVVEMALEAADGMTYLAWRRLVHRDLAARNCLLDHNLTLKIGDFGLSRNLQSNYYRKEGHGVLPVRWMAPESLQFSVYSSQSDVWSYGVLLWEMATRGDTPYKNNTNDEVMRLVVEQRARLGSPPHCPLPLLTVMRRCWNYNPARRPSFSAVASFLLKHVSDHFEERFERVSFFHSLMATNPSAASDDEDLHPLALSTASDEEDLYPLALLTNTSDLSHDSTPDREAREWHGVCREGRLPSSHPRPSPLLLPHQRAAQHASLYYTFDTHTPGKQEVQHLPTQSWLNQLRAVSDPHVYTNCATVDFLPQAPPSCAPSSEVATIRHLTPVATHNEGGAGTFPAALTCGAPPSAASSDTSPPASPGISDSPTTASAPSSPVSNLRLTKPFTFPEGALSPSSSLPQPMCNVPSVFINATAALPVAATPAPSGYSSQLHSPSGESFTSLLEFPNEQFTVFGRPSSSESRALRETDTSFSSTPSPALFSCTSLPVLSLPTLDHPPTTAPAPTSVSVAALTASALPLSLSCPSNTSTFSATSDLASGRRCRSVSRRSRSSLGAAGGAAPL